MQETTIMSSRRRSSSQLEFDPTRKGPNVLLTNNNKRVRTNNGDAVLGTIGHSTGKWYFEVKFIQAELSSGVTYPLVGIGNYNTNLHWPWLNGTEEIMYYCSGSNVSQILYGASKPRFSYGVFSGIGDVVGVALDMDNRKLQFYRNGVAMGILNIGDYIPGAIFYPLVSSAAGGGGDSVVDGLFGTDLIYPVPIGYSAW